MMPAMSERHRRIAYILHVGCVLIRNIALGNGSHVEIAELADALELLPRYLTEEPTDKEWQMVEFVVRNFHAQFPDTGWRLVKWLEHDIPERY